MVAFAGLAILSLGIAATLKRLADPTVRSALKDWFVAPRVPLEHVRLGSVPADEWKQYEGKTLAEASECAKLSIGDFVLSGGEVAAMVVMDAVVRLVPGVLGDAQSAVDESFGPDGGLEYPQYTRPREFRGKAVPEVLLSGDHAAIARWRLARRR